MGFINEKIERNEYFFADILKEGVMLFDSGNFNLSEPRTLSPQERKRKAENAFQLWFNSASRLLEGLDIYLQKGNENPEYYKEAAFLLHQSVERLYNTTLLVFTDYKPKIHDIEKLERQVEKLHAHFGIVFPKNTPEEKRLFELLQKAYIDDRNSEHYQIVKTELEYLASGLAC